jgi:signal transduction histidine kinase
LLARRVVRRLERLGRAAEALASGQLAVRVEDMGDDELGQLAARFNQMAGDLQGSLNQLMQERDRVTGLLKARRELVASVSHELRTPVATVRGYLESALRRGDRLPEDLRADLETIQAEIRRLQRLIEDLFTLARAEVGQLELRLEPTNIGAVVQHTVDTAAPLAWNQWRVQVVSEAEPDLAPARADAERLQQVLSNLVSNAVRHTPPGGLVAAAVRAEDGALRVDVRDTGAGITPDDLPRVFERFYRGREEDGRDGAGLGLAVSKELVEAMGGTIQAESVAGEGSCFTVRLPRI